MGCLARIGGLEPEQIKERDAAAEAYRKQLTDMVTSKPAEPAPRARSRSGGGRAGTGDRGAAVQPGANAATPPSHAQAVRVKSRAEFEALLADGKLSPGDPVILPDGSQVYVRGQ